MKTSTKVIVAVAGLVAVGMVMAGVAGLGYWWLGSEEPEVASTPPQEIQVTQIPVTEEAEEPLATEDIPVEPVEEPVRPLHPLLEARPEVGALAAYTSADGANFRQTDKDGEWTRLERSYWLPESQIKLVKPEWAKGDKRERVVLTSVVPAFEVSGEEPEYGVNDYAVTATPVDGKHRVVSTACVNAALLGLTPPESCPEQVTVECDRVKPGDCSLVQLGAELEAKATPSPETEATAEEITLGDLMKVLLQILAVVEAKKGT